MLHDLRLVVVHLLNRMGILHNHLSLFRYLARPVVQLLLNPTDDSTTINRHGPNQPAPQLDPKRPVATAEEFPPRLIPERTLYPIIESSITNRSEDENNSLGCTVTILM